MGEGRGEGQGDRDVGEGQGMRGEWPEGRSRRARGEGRGARGEARGARHEARGATIGSGSGYAAAMVRTAGIAWSSFCRSLGGVLFSVLLMSLLMSPLVSLGCGSSLEAVIVLPEGHTAVQAVRKEEGGGRWRKMRGPDVSRSWLKVARV